MSTTAGPIVEPGSVAAEILAAPGSGAASPEMVAAHDALHTASDALRIAVGHLHAGEDDAWRRYAAEAGDVMARMEAELAVSAAKLRADRADSRASLGAALEAAARTWRARADEIRVQTRLGEMDARDGGLVALDDLDAAGYRLVGLIQALGHDVEGLEVNVVERARSAVDDVRAAVAGLVLIARADDEGEEDELGRAALRHGPLAIVDHFVRGVRWEQ